MMANLGNDNSGAAVSADLMADKTWRTPLMEKMDVTIHTLDDIGSGSDGTLQNS